MMKRALWIALTGLIIFAAYAFGQDSNKTIYLPIITAAVTETLTPVPIDEPTVTPVSPPTTATSQPPTSTPYPTMTPGGPTGIGVIGDSNSVAYQDWGRSGPDSRSWIEISHELRDADFGPYLSQFYNRASYWNKSRNTLGQASALEGYIQNGELRIILIWTGSVDMYEMCNTPQTSEQLDFIWGQMTTYPADALDMLISYGFPANKIYMVTQHYESYEFPCSNSAQYEAFVDDVNVELTNMITSRGVNLIDGHRVFDALAAYQINDNGDMMIDGHLVEYRRCDAPECLFVADGNFNTVLQGIAFNTFFAEPLMFSPLTDHEIAVIASLE